MSQINPYNIDGTYPVAGQDNNSQGFRDNFTNIRNNFTYAYSEISDLQGKAILTSALTGGTLTNNMNYNVLQKPQLDSESFTIYNQGTLGQTTVILDYSQARVQKVTTSGSLTLSFANWPTAAQGMGILRLWVYISNTAHTVTLPTTSPGVTIGLNDIAGANATTGIITFDQVGNYLLEFSTIDGGSTIFITDVSRNSATLRDPNFYWNDSIVSTLFAGFGTNSTVLSGAISADAGRSTIVASGQYSATSVGNLTLANLTYATLDTGPAAGYNLTSLRGNLQTGTYTPVQNTDQLGYINAVTFTGNGTSNVFTQVSRIDFHATGSNVVTGLGGNIALYTAPQGLNSLNSVNQAVGVENDQSVKFFGNVLYSGGVVDQGYQYLSSPSAGFWANMTPGKSRFIIDALTTIASGNVTMPNVTVDGTIVSIHSTATITTFGANTVQSGVAMRSNATYTLSAGTGVDYFYHLSENTWYKIR